MSRKPCIECPFARKTAPGATGGATPTTYIGQAVGPFLLSCHMDHGYEANRRSPDLLQCAGAAAFRANIGVAEILPERLLRCEADTELVFATPAELLAHHAELPVAAAADVLRVVTPATLLRIELGKAGVQTVAMPKKD